MKRAAKVLVDRLPVTGRASSRPSLTQLTDLGARVTAAAVEYAVSIRRANKISGVLTVEGAVHA